MTENQIQNNILHYLNAIQYVVPIFWRQNTGGANYNHITKSGIKKSYHVQFGRRGIADILGVMNDGRFLAIEVKRPKNKPTIYQQDFIDRINNAGGLAFVATSADEVHKHFGSEGYINE